MSGRGKFGNGFARTDVTDVTDVKDRRKKEEGRGKREEGRRKNATGNVWDLTYTRKQKKGRSKVVRLLYLGTLKLTLLTRGKRF